MATQYSLKNGKIEKQEVSMDAVAGGDIVQVFTTEEFDKVYAPVANHSVSAEPVYRTVASHADLFGDWAAGVISEPNKTDLIGAPINIGFLLDADHLVLIDNTTIVADALAAIAVTFKGSQQTPARIFFHLLEHLIANDPVFLEDFESRLEAAEERIVDMNRAEADRAISQLRRELLRLGDYYEQLEDIADLMVENENGLLSDAEARLFGIFSRHADRLFDRTRTLKEYSLQLHELQQTQIDLKQNETMRWLTVITSIFVPLTLVTSWYGMNFRFMPELDWEYGYAVVIGICLVIVIAELLFFKHRKWL